MRWSSTFFCAETAEDCLRQFDLLPCDDLHHRLSTLFLSPSGFLRIAVEQISKRQRTLDHFPDLKQASLRVTFVIVVERTIEGDHARAHRKVVHTRHASGPVVSTTLRGSEIQALCAEPVSFKALAEILDKVGNCKQILAEQSLPS